MTTIIGIDPALGSVGWGAIKIIGSELKFIDSGTIKTNSKESLSKRINFIHDNLSSVIKRYNPDEISLEETFVNKNAASSLTLGQARGSIILTCAIHGFEVFEYSPTKIKKSVVGVGRADKEQVKMMVKCLMPTAEINSMDEADALAIAICHVSNRNQFG